MKYIEDGKVTKIPEHIPVKGFIKSYAKLLNVDIEEELNLIETSPDKQLSTVVSKNKKGKNQICFNLLYSYFLFFSFDYLFGSVTAESEKSDEDSFLVQKKDYY